jgi:hypothetical protein
MADMLVLSEDKTVPRSIAPGGIFALGFNTCYQYYLTDSWRQNYLKLPSGITRHPFGINSYDFLCHFE